MKVQIQKSELEARLRQLSAVTDKKNAIPALSYIRLKAANGAITMTGRDTGAALIVPAKATVLEDQNGAMLLPVGMISAIIASLPQPEVFLESTPEHVTLKCGRYTAKLTSLPAEAYPADHDTPDANLVDGLGLAGLQAIIKKIDFSVPKSDGRSSVSVGLLHATGTELRAVGTDGNCLAIAQTQLEGQPFTLALPKEAFSLIQNLPCVDGSKISIGMTDVAYFFQTESALLIVHKSSGDFPPYERILPTKHSTAITIGREIFEQAISRAMPFVSDETKSLAFKSEENGKLLSIKAAAVTGLGSTDDVDVESNGPAATFVANGEALEAFIKSATDTVVIRTTSQSLDILSGPFFRFVLALEQ